MRHGQDPSRDQLHLLGKPSAGTGVTSPLLGREDGNWSMMIVTFREMPGVIQDASLTLNT